MDPSDDDSQMIDAPESSSRGLLRAPERGGRPPNGNMLFTGLPGSNMPNRLQDPQRYATPMNSDSDIPNRPRRRMREPSRESSILANSVANHLSIEGPHNGLDDKVIDLMDDSADEHEPPKPFMSSLPQAFAMMFVCGITVSWILRSSGWIITPRIQGGSSRFTRSCVWPA